MTAAAGGAAASAAPEVPAPDATGHPWLDILLTWGGALVVLAAAGGAAWRVGHAGLRLARRLGQLVDDWTGTPGRPGVPDRPGVMERLAALADAGRRTDRRLGTVERRLELIEHELHPNQGSSLADAIRRTDERTQRLCPDPDLCDGDGDQEPPEP